MNMKASNKKKKQQQTTNVSSGAGKEKRFIIIPGLMAGWRLIEGCSEREQHKVL